MRQSFVVIRWPVVAIERYDNQQHLMFRLHGTVQPQRGR